MVSYKFQEGDPVTWGSGDIQGMVVEVKAGGAVVELTKTYRSPCGRSWPAGGAGGHTGGRAPPADVKRSWRKV